MKKYLTACLLTVCVLSVRAQEPFREYADSLADDYLDEPGGLIIGIHDNGKERVYYYGEMEGGLPDDSSLFELGTLSETFVCVVYADMSVQGQVGTDDALRKFLPVEVTAPVYEKVVCHPVDDGLYEDPLKTKGEMRIRFTPLVCLPDSSAVPQPIRLCYLATHTSGLPARPGNLDKHARDAYAGYTADDLYAYLGAFRLDEPIGFDYRHSELGIALLAHALERHKGMPYATLLRDHVLDSLNMEHTGLRPGDDGVMAPAVGLRSTAGDMMKFLGANVSRKKDHMVYLLDYTHNPRIMLSEGKEKMEIALGWKVSPLRGPQRMVWNGGTTAGYAAWMGFNEANHTGVILLSTRPVKLDAVGRAILEKLVSERL